ncbi:MAG TPA: sigma-70 family RNA polymerase sigma factor [Vicinamibacteria bacterium]
MSRLHSGEVSSLEALYDRYSGFVHALALRVLGRTEEAEEVVQDVFWQLWKSKIRYDPAQGRFSTWLFVITRNRSLDRLRSKRRTPSAQPLSIDAPGPAAGNDPEQSASIAERRRYVLSALGRLPSEQRQALELAFYQGLTHREIAERLGEPLGTIKSRIKMAMDKLRLNLRGVESAS